MGDTLTTVNAFTKEFYGDDWFLQYSPKSALLAKDTKGDPAIKRGGSEYLKSEPTGGRKFYIPAVFGAPESGAFISDGGDWPTAGNISATASTVDVSQHIHTVQLTAGVIHLLDNDRKSFGNMMEVTMDLAKGAFHQDWATYLYGDGTGYIGCVKSVSGSGPYTVVLSSKADLGSTLGSTTVSPDFVTNPVYFRNGMKFKAKATNATRGGGADRSGSGTITNIDPLNSNGPTLTCSAIPTSLAAGDHLYTNALGSGTIQDGLFSTVDDGTYKTTFQGISRSSYGLWKSVIKGNGGTARPLSLPLIRETVTSISTMGGNIDLIVSNWNIRDQYISTLQPDIRFGSVREFDGGFVGAPYTMSDGRTISWVADQYSPFGRLWFLDTSKLTHFEAKSEHWDETTGGIWRQAIGSGTAVYASAYVAAFQRFGNFGTTVVCASGCLKDIQE